MQYLEILPGFQYYFRQNGRLVHSESAGKVCKRGIIMQKINLVFKISLLLAKILCRSSLLSRHNPQCLSRFTKSQGWKNMQRGGSEIIARKCLLPLILSSNAIDAGGPGFKSWVGKIDTVWPTGERLPTAAAFFRSCVKPRR